MATVRLQKFLTESIAINLADWNFRGIHGNSRRAYNADRGGLT